MTASREIAVSADCRCGASVSIKTDSISVAESLLRMWNRLHDDCAGRGEHSSGPDPRLVHKVQVGA